MLVGALAGLIVVVAFVLGSIYGKGIKIQSSPFMDYGNTNTENYNNLEDVMPEIWKQWIDKDEKSPTRNIRTGERSD